MPAENKISSEERFFDLTSHAEDDLKNIWVYVAEHNENAAGKLLKELFDKFHLLSKNKKLGKQRDEILLGLRSFPHKNFIIFYTSRENSRIEIYRVIHASRDIEGLFEEFFEGLEE